jgi:hypothetical protein
MSRRRDPRLSVTSIVLLAGMLAACSGTATGTPASPSDGRATNPSAPTSPASTSPASTPPGDGGVIDPLVPTACVTLGASDCERARTLAASVLEPGDPVVTYVQVGPFACAISDPCPTTLAARPEGDVVIEFRPGEGINVHLKVAPDGTFEAERGDAMGVGVEAASLPGIPAGPFEFSLGHCGVFSGIDLDGNWWDPVGQVPMDSGEAVNATAGMMAVSDPDHATFTTPTGFAIQLQRRAGPKLLPLCM